jgi:hypothetical protein
MPRNWTSFAMVAQGRVQTGVVVLAVDGDQRNADAGRALVVATNRSNPDGQVVRHLFD